MTSAREKIRCLDFRKLLSLGFLFSSQVVEESDFWIFQEIDLDLIEFI